MHTSSDHLLNNSTHFTDYIVEVKDAEAEMGKATDNGHHVLNRWNFMCLFRFVLKMFLLAMLYKFFKTKSSYLRALEFDAEKALLHLLGYRCIPDTDDVVSWWTLLRLLHRLLYKSRAPN